MRHPIAGPATLSQLPSLDFMRGFVAVGRRMSVTLAAADLCVTQSAVSRQIRALEDRLGAKLFVRRHRSLAFTPEGERLFRRADEALRSLHEAVGSLRSDLAARSVTISCSVGVAGLWLLPRLADFLSRQQRIDVRVCADNGLGELRSLGVDVAIRYCAPQAAPAGAEHLFDEDIAPVAHPSIGLKRLRSPDDLQRYVLLEFDGEYRPWLRWSEWLAQRGWQGAKAKAVLRFNRYDQMIHAAIAGQGLALGRLPLVRAALADGRLAIVRAPGEAPATEHAYWLIRAASAPRPEVDAVADWLKREAPSAAA